MNMAYGYFVESRAKRQFAELFGQYVPPELVDKMAADPSKYNMAPKSAELTILFSDVRGFTSISEALKPEELREYINEYLTDDEPASSAAKHRGTLDKYIGDAIMAFWGAPVEDAQHARNGVLAALEMQRECSVLNETFAARGWPRAADRRRRELRQRPRRRHGLAACAAPIRRWATPVNVASRLEARTEVLWRRASWSGEATRNRVRTWCSAKSTASR